MKFPQGKRGMVEKVKPQRKMILLFCYLEHTALRAGGTYYWHIKQKAELGALLPLWQGKEVLFPTNLIQKQQAEL